MYATTGHKEDFAGWNYCTGLVPSAHSHSFLYPEVAMNRDPAADGSMSSTQTTALADQRKEHNRASLSENEVAADPVTQFSHWFDQAQAARLPEPNAMSLATVGADGRPSSRIVLIKQFDSTGFTWFTSYGSRKGTEIEGGKDNDGSASNPGHPFAALLFHWVELERQVRIEGRVARVSAAESDVYFHSRPLGSQLSAIASQQSQPVADRAALEQQFADTESRYGKQPRRPDNWGGYRLVPDYFEFWQGRPSRLHDRIVYRLQDDGQWIRERLQP
jgi:pyridoxamine 5'-phosphate oxidase